MASGAHPVDFWRYLAAFHIATGDDDLGGTETNHPTAGLKSQAAIAACDDGSPAFERCGRSWRGMDKLTVDEVYKQHVEQQYVQIEVIAK